MNKSITKPCNICHIPKPLTEFTKDPQCKLGVTNRCKICTKEYHKKYYQRTRGKGFNWRDFKDLSLTPEEEFNYLYGGADVEVEGKLVMKEGKIIDKKWYEKKLARIKKSM